MDNLKELESHADEEEKAIRENMKSEEIKERQILARQEHLQSLQKQIDELHQKEAEVFVFLFYFVIVHYEFSDAV